MNPMEIKQVLKCLPHRYPFLLIDKVISLELNKSLVAIKNVTINEEFFNGHFPAQPVMPGVLMIEALAQACGILILQSDPSINLNTNAFLLAGIDDARFKRMVVPGDQLHLSVELLQQKVSPRSGIYKFKATATVDGELACSAQIINARSTRSD